MRIRSSLLFLAMAVVLVVGITWWRSHGTPAEAIRTASDAAASIPTPQTSVRPARRNASIPPNELRLPRGERVRAHRAQQRAAAERVVTAGRNKIVGKYESEAIDPAWSNTTRQALISPALTASDQIRATHSEPSNLAVDCRSTTCRITADFPTTVAADDWSTLYITGAGDRLPNASLQKTANADGSVHLEIYATARR
jgi:hypothetical protein